MNKELQKELENMKNCYGLLLDSELESCM